MPLHTEPGGLEGRVVIWDISLETVIASQEDSLSPALAYTHAYHALHFKQNFLGHATAYRLASGTREGRGGDLGRQLWDGDCQSVGSPVSSTGLGACLQCTSFQAES